MFKKLFNLLICVLTTGFAFAGTPSFPTDIPIRLDTVPGECSWPAPLNFHVEDAGTNWVKLAWNPVMPGVVAHRVKTYDDANVLISNIVVPANQDWITILGILYNNQYHSTINAICSDGSDSKDIGTVGFPTGVITDLIVSGITPPSYYTDCVMDAVGESCDFPITGNIETYFQIRLANNQNSGRKFKVFEIPGSVNILRTGVSSAADDYFFRIDWKVPNAQTGTAGYYFEVFRSALPPKKPTRIAVYELFIHYDDAYQPIGRIQCDTLTNGYELIQMTENPGYYKQPGSSTLQQEEGSEDRNGALIDQAKFSAAPNPFTETLEVSLGQNTPGLVRLQLLNLSGQIVLDRQVMAGLAPISLPTTQLAPGFYMLRMEAGGVMQTLKVVKSE